MKILVTGSHGQLGSEFRRLQPSSPHEFKFTDSNDLDITNLDDLKRFFDQNRVDVILNCAAYTAVDEAEDQKDMAFAVNRNAVSNLGTQCKRHNTKLIHFSTDYVFNGKGVAPYNESDIVNPLGVYGASKLAGEQLILDSDISALIIRTSWLYSEYGKNFVKTMMALGREREGLGIVYDQIGTPTNARDLAKASLVCIDKIKDWTGDRKLYHYSNEGVTSWYDFALSIFELHQITCKVAPILSKDYPVKAPRPAYSVLDKHKFKADFGVKIPHWRASLQSLNFNN